MKIVARVGTTALAVALASAVLISAPGCRGSSPKAERTCSEGQALQSGKMRGNGLPPKTISLTFDDGPGTRTVELSHFLKAEGIRAAFFVMGSKVPPGAAGEALLRALVDDGHIIANHTWSHQNLTTITPQQVVDEITQTDALIAPFVPDGRFLFRPPYGAWNDSVLAALEPSPMNKYFGPVDWDLGFQMSPTSAADWDCWSAEGVSDPPVIDVATCGNLYLQQIRAVSSGIVLLHDPYFIGDLAANGGTVDMVKNIVPVLKAEGFTFVRVDEVPTLASVLPKLGSTADAGVEAGVDASGDASPEPPAPVGELPDGASTSGTAATGQPTVTPAASSTDPCSSSPQGSSAKP